MSQVSAYASSSSYDPHAYHEFLTALETQFTTRLSGPATRLFTTDSESLFELFLSYIPAPDQQFYTCRACRRFVNAYGGLVTIDAHGNTTSAVWNGDVPEYFLAAVTGLRYYVQLRRVTGVFLSSDKVWGTPQTGEWSHMAIRPNPSILHPTNQVKSAFQMMAEKREDFKNMTTALHGSETATALAPETVKMAVSLLESDALYRSEKVLGAAKWLMTLQETLTHVKSRQRENLLWRAVALAPVGYCHPRSSMIGTLLEDIESGSAFKNIERRFRAKMDGLQYQRPQVAPAAQNIARAELLVEKLGIANSLKRRYARLEEVTSIWLPSDPARKTRPKGASDAAVFGHLAAKNEAQAINAKMKMPVTTMTVEKFRRTVLPTARTIEFWVPSQFANYTALVTAEDYDAPPILQWDQIDHRNPVSSYVYHRGSDGTSWGLTPHTLCKVTAITEFPAMWNKDSYLPHMGDGLIMLLQGARDSIYRHAGAALFPEILKTDLREVRSTIEAYSKKAVIAGYEESSACGLILDAKTKAGHRFRVTTDTMTTDYELDRWD